jgi:hypothetical protein
MTKMLDEAVAAATKNDVVAEEKALQAAGVAAKQTWGMTGEYRQRVSDLTGKGEIRHGRYIGSVGSYLFWADRIHTPEGNVYTLDANMRVLVAGRRSHVDPTTRPEPHMGLEWRFSIERRTSEVSAYNYAVYLREFALGLDDPYRVDWTGTTVRVFSYDRNDVFGECFVIVRRDPDSSTQPYEEIRLAKQVVGTSCSIAYQVNKAIAERMGIEGGTIGASFGTDEIVEDACPHCGQFTEGAYECRHCFHSTLRERTSDHSEQEPADVTGADASAPAAAEHSPEKVGADEFLTPEPPRTRWTAGDIERLLEEGGVYGAEVTHATFIGIGVPGASEFCPRYAFQAETFRRFRAIVEVRGKGFESLYVVKSRDVV